MLEIENAISQGIIGCAIEVHRHLGPGLLESIYEQCLQIELELAGFEVVNQQHLPLIYKGRDVGQHYRFDFLINQRVIVEVKAVDQLSDVHHAQLLTYLKLTRCHLGLLINFNVDLLKDGIRRVVL